MSTTVLQCCMGCMFRVHYRYSFVYSCNCISLLVSSLVSHKHFLLSTGGGKVQDKNLPTNIADYSQMTWDDGKERDENQPAEIADYFQTTWDDGKEQDDNLPTKIADYSQMTLNDGIEGDDDALSEMADYSVMTFEDGKVQHRILPTEIADTSATPIDDSKVRNESVLTEIRDSSAMTTEDCSEVLEQITNGGEDGGHVYEGLQSFIPNEFSRWKKLRDQMLPHSDLLKYTRRVVEDEFTSWTDDEAFASYLLDW